MRGKSPVAGGDKKGEGRGGAKGEGDATALSAREWERRLAELRVGLSVKGFSEGEISRLLEPLVGGPTRG